MEPTLPPPTEQVIAELGKREEPLLNSRLTELSNLNAAEIKSFKKTWALIESERRRQIVHRLVELADDNVELNFNNIFRYCLKDRDDEVRTTVIEGLWENEEASLINPLISLLDLDNSETVQAAAATALGKFAIMAEENKLHPDQTTRIQEALLAAINDKKRPAEARRRALESAAPLSIPQVQTAIQEAYQSPDFKQKVSAVYAMGKSCDHSWLQVLLKELSNPDAEMRYEAAGACGEFEEEATVPGLIKLIGDFDTDVQIAAIQALGKIGNTQARESLKQSLENEKELIRQTAEKVLNELETREDPLSFRL